MNGKVEGLSFRHSWIQGLDDTLRMESLSTSQLYWQDSLCSAKIAPALVLLKAPRLYVIGLALATCPSGISPCGHREMECADWLGT